MLRRLTNEPVVKEDWIDKTNAVVSQRFSQNSSYGFMTKAKQFAQIQKRHVPKPPNTIIYCILETLDEANKPEQYFMQSPF